MYHIYTLTITKLNMYVCITITIIITITITITIAITIIRRTSAKHADHDAGTMHLPSVLEAGKIQASYEHTHT